MERRSRALARGKQVPQLKDFRSLAPLRVGRKIGGGSSFAGTHHVFYGIMFTCHRDYMLFVLLSLSEKPRHKLLGLNIKSLADAE